MFEQYTFDYIMKEALARASEGIDTREGSIYWDAVAGIALTLSRFYGDLNSVRQMATINTAVGDALDVKAVEYGLERHGAIPAQYRAEYEGGPPKEGDRFYYDLHYFVFTTAESIDGPVEVFEAEIAGEDGNNILPGTPAVPVVTNPNLQSATFGAVFQRGADIESDSDFRDRILEKVGGPAVNGNKAHYKMWCESREGVGVARIFPLWLGENTVKAVLIDMNGYPVSEEVVQDVQEYIDPCGKGMTREVDGKVYNYGDGLGNGVANIGAHFTAVAADELKINVAFEVTEKQPSASQAKVKADVQEKIKDYLKEIVIHAKEGDKVVVRYNNIGALLSDIEGLIDFAGLKVNDGQSNIYPTDEQVAILGEVDMAWPE